MTCYVYSQLIIPRCDSVRDAISYGQSCTVLFDCVKWRPVRICGVSTCVVVTEVSVHPEVYQEYRAPVCVLAL